MLELDSLRRRFGETVALDGLSFAVERGELCGFLGPNGAGKTTAMRAVLGVTRLDGGEVRWDGRPIDRDVRRRTGYLPEERGLYPKMPVAAQLTYLARLRGLDRAEARRRAHALLEELGLGDRADAVTEELSLGNQQRVQVAAAVVHEPELLVLDEPFSGLDPIAVDTMSAMLRRRAEAGAAVVFSSHQLDLVGDLCRTVAIVVEGREVLTGAVRELRAAAGARLRLAVDGDPSWVDGLPPGVEVRTTDEHGAVTLVLDPVLDPGGILDLARRAGRLREVRLEPPTLSELFREAVGRPLGGSS